MAELIIHTEPLNLGLTTSRSGTVLVPGELVRCDNCCYLPDSQAVFIAPTTFNYATGLGNPVLGLQYCAFDFVKFVCNTTADQITITPATGTFSNIAVGAKVRGDNILENTTVATVSSSQITLSQGPIVDVSTATIFFEAQHLLVAQSGNNFFTSPIVLPGATGTFAAQQSCIGGPSLVSVQGNNNHYLFDGVDENQVLTAKGTFRAHGLSPVKTTLDAVTASGGSWGNATGYYRYWSTEYDNVNDIESAFDAPLGSVLVNMSTATTKVTLTAPARKNASATHVKFYRSARLTSTTLALALKEDLFPNGNLIGGLVPFESTTNPIAQLVDGQALTTATAASPTTARSATVAKQNATGGYVTPRVYLSWTSPNNAVGAGNTTLSYSTADQFGTSDSRQARFNGLALRLTGWTLGVPAGAVITGINVTVKAAKAGNGRIRVEPWSENFNYLLKGSYYSEIVQSKSLNLATGAVANIVVGGSNDLWIKPGVSWSSDDFTTSNFSLYLKGFVNTTGDSAIVDQVTVSVAYGAADQSSAGEAYASLNVRTLDETIGYSQNGEPAKADIGEMFQNSLVTNSVEDERLMKFSYPERYDAFPSPYYLVMESDEQDKITNISALGDVMIVGLRSRLYRIAYLPKAEDAQFDRGRATNLIDDSRGISGVRSSCRYSLPDGVLRLAFLGRNGVYTTDGYRVKPLTTKVNFNALFDKDNLYRAVFINNTDLQELLLYYVPKGSGTPTRLTKALRFSYHQTHLLDDGSLKTAGPCDADARSAVVGTLRDGATPLYIGSGLTGTVFLGNSGALANATVRTRSMSLAGVGQDWRYDDSYLQYVIRTITALSPGYISSSLLVDKVNAVRRVVTAKDAAILAYPNDGAAYPSDEKQVKFVFNQSGQTIATELTFGSANVSMGLDYLAIRGADMGRENPK